MGIPDHLTCLLRDLYAGQEATLRTGHGTTDWFQIEKRVHQSYILSRCLFNFYAEYLMRNAGLEEAQAGIMITGINIDNLRYADDTTLMAESEEELKSLLFFFFTFVSVNFILFIFILIFIFTLFYFTILYWFCRTLTWTQRERERVG